MSTGIVYGRSEPKKEEKTSIELNKEQTTLIEEIVDKINMYYLSTYIRESLICIFSRYDYLKNNTFRIVSLNVSNTIITINLLNEENIKTKIEIEFRLGESRWDKDFIIEKIKISNISIEIGKSKIVPNNHYNKYVIFININNLIRNAS